MRSFDNHIAIDLEPVVGRDSLSESEPDESSRVRISDMRSTERC